MGLTLSKGFAIWITGLPASGKSTIAKALSKKLAEQGVKVQILESDELRRVLTPKPSYTEEERDNFYQALLYIGKLLTDNGVNVIFDATANKRKYRDEARKRIERFMLVYVKCPLEVCIKRDPKGIYKAAFEGRATTVPGLQVKYEEPEEAEVVVESDKEQPEEAAVKILRRMKELLNLS